MSKTMLKPPHQMLPESIAGQMLAAGGLSERHALFAWLYGTSGQRAYCNGVQAYLEAGFNTKSRVCAKAAAWRLRQHPKVKAALRAIYRAEREFQHQQMLELDRERRLLLVRPANPFRGRR